MEEMSYHGELWPTLMSARGMSHQRTQAESTSAPRAPFFILLQTPTTSFFLCSLSTDQASPAAYCIPRRDISVLYLDPDSRPSTLLCPPPARSRLRHFFLPDSPYTS